jgi:hypothetical protein
MQEIELTKSDFRNIMDYAHRLYIEKSVQPYGHENFLCACYIEAIKWYASSKKWTIEGGKIFQRNEK